VETNKRGEGGTELDTEFLESPNAPGPFDSCPWDLSVRPLLCIFCSVHVLSCEVIIISMSKSPEYACF
jgi:hypothetical protein